jgi:hypothetical protein
MGELSRKFRMMDDMVLLMMINEFETFETILG